MDRRVIWLLGSGFVICSLGASSVMAVEPEAGAAEGKPGVEQPASGASPSPTATAAPTLEQIRDAVQRYVEETTQDEGVFYVDDDITGETRELTLERVHDTFSEAGDYYYVCTDMKDDKSGESLDVDFDVESYEGELEVVDIRIHKVGGTERYTYDEHGNRQ